MDTRDRIFKLLDAKKIEQKAFAAQVGVSEGTVSNWRRGVSSSYTRYLVKIAQVLGTTTADLLGEQNENSPLPEEGGLLADYDALTARNQEKVREYLALLLASQDKP